MLHAHLSATYSAEAEGSGATVSWPLREKIRFLLDGELKIYHLVHHPEGYRVEFVGSDFYHIMPFCKTAEEAYIEALHFCRNNSEV